MDSMIEVLYQWESELAAAGRAPATIMLRISHIRWLLSDMQKPLDEITRNDLIQWLSTQTWGPAARENMYSSLRLFWKWCLRLHYCSEDITLDLPAIRKIRSVPRPIPDEILLAAISNAKPNIRLAIELMAMCGLRRAECAAVNSKDVQVTSGGFALRVTGKGGHSRLVPCPPHLAKAILAAHGWVFPGRSSGHMVPACLGKHISNALPPGWTPHKLRHRYATVTYQKSHDIRAVQELLGHSSVATTQVYVAVSEDAVRAAASAAWEISA